MKKQKEGREGITRVSCASVRIKWGSSEAKMPPSYRAEFTAQHLTAMSDE